MRLPICALLSAVLLCGFDARGESRTPGAAKVQRKCAFPQSNTRAPDWVCTARAEGMALAAVGSAAKSPAGAAFMEQMAAADARARLVREVRESVRSRGAGGAPATDKREGAEASAITKDTLIGSKIARRVYGPEGTLYVLVGLNAANAKRLVDSVTAEYRKQQSSPDGTK
ncbi:MAG: LPP20 family lipoprotein [Sideroxyarcus sp.]|nr:LPP20 family lipoprotein [Sideroxyarcus sp.]